METMPVREQLLNHARVLLMTRGYNGFSYRDLAALVGVKTSSIHYYFPTKEDLVLEAVNGYSTEMLAQVRAIDDRQPASRQLEQYAKAFGVLMHDGDRICLCGMLAADIASLPDNIRSAVQGFFKANESWLEKVLARGQEDGTLRVSGDRASAARALYAAFQGSVLAGRLFGSKARLKDVVAAVKAG
ncbi:TetR/AcrR family transcriptional regulator [Bordetella genomosp. 9]|uniref:TetR family transcriptional regulator n=1 Tax=Bordetella genomosp. 9 TaxID=1416803 RepID=A0A1W6YWH9_9BORD|nr:TetR/AcrR family transcriptional regulator [Bordetella genomosp. 9]ARP85378.1 TetR family transcriptional regulator [Bordetella genomosp. 9]ARP89361.1 TetR family transcriptional regulator [Bordetella genomosp. 9]